MNALPSWLGDSVAELVRDYMGLENKARAGHFEKLLKRCESKGKVIEVDGKSGIGAIAGVELLEWDSRHFGTGCARLSPVCVAPELDVELRLAAVSQILDRTIGWCRDNSIRVLQRRLVGARAQEARLFEDRGFRLVDSIITMTALPSTAGAELKVRPAAEQDRQVLLEIVKGAYPHSRFLAEPAFDQEKARMVYVHWLETLLDGVGEGEKSGTDAKVLVGECEGQVAGFLAIRRDRAPEALAGQVVAPIELFAVAPALRGRGVGRSLLAAGRQWAGNHGAGIVEASTWAPAVDSRQAYRHSGFEMRDTLLTFHGLIA